MNKANEKLLQQGRKRRASILSKWRRSGLNKAAFADKLGISRQRLCNVIKRAIEEAAQ